MRQAMLAGVLLLATGQVVASGAPYCVHAAGPPLCVYYTVSSCKSAAASFGGICAPNPEAAASAQPDPATSIKSIVDSFESARQRRREREESEARIELLKAQARAIERTPATISVYVCEKDGGRLYTATPTPGCVYLGEANPAPATP